MSSALSILIVSLVLCATLHCVLASPHPAHPGSTSTPCPSQCRFRFCESSGPPLLPLTLPDMSVTPAVCAHNYARITLGATGEPRIQLRPVTGGGRVAATPYIAASKLRDASGRSLHLPRSVFKAYIAHEADALDDGASGLGSKTMSAAQRAALDGACVRLPVLQWQITDFPGARVRNGEMRNAATDCVAFRVTRPRVEARLVWRSGGDLDLQVVRPSGETVFHAAARSRDALFVRDGDGACNGGMGGTEAIAFVGGATIVPGVYFVRVRRFRKCVVGEVGFEVEVRVDGQKIWSRSEVIGKEDADEFEMGWAVNVAL